MLSLLITILPYVLGLFIIIALIFAIRNFRIAQTASYFRIRRDANNRAWRWMLGIVLAGLGIGAALQMRRYVEPADLSEILPDREAPTQQVLQPEGSPAAAATDAPDTPPTITPTEAAVTPSATSLIATIDTTITPPADASMTVTDIASGISSQLQPINAGTTFSEGISRVYFWLEYTDMVDGVSWSRVLLLNGEVVRTESEAWEQGTDGVAYYWFEAQGGWPAGQYEVRFYVGDEVLTTAAYEVVN